MPPKQDLVLAFSAQRDTMKTSELREIYAAVYAEVFRRWQADKKLEGKREHKVKQRAAQRARKERRRLGTKGASNGLTSALIRELVEKALDVHLARRAREKKKRGAVANNSWQCAQTLGVLMKPLAKGQPIPTIPQIVASIRVLAKDPAQRIEFWQGNEDRRRAANLRPFRRRMPRS